MLPPSVPGTPSWSLGGRTAAVPRFKQSLQQGEASASVQGSVRGRKRQVHIQRVAKSIETHLFKSIFVSRILEASARPGRSTLWLLVGLLGPFVFVLASLNAEEHLSARLAAPFQTQEMWKKRKAGRRLKCARPGMLCSIQNNGNVHFIV